MLLTNRERQPLGSPASLEPPPNSIEFRRRWQAGRGVSYSKPVVMRVDKPLP